MREVAIANLHGLKEEFIAQCKIEQAKLHNPTKEQFVEAVQRAIATMEQRYGELVGMFCEELATEALRIALGGKDDTTDA